MLDRIIKFALSHRLLVLASAALLVAYGGWIAKNLPVDVFPDLKVLTNLDLSLHSSGLEKRIGRR